MINEGKDIKRWEDYDTIVCPDGQVIDMNKLLADQSRAKVALNNLDPFLGSMVNMLRFVYTFRVQTQATDGYNIFVNPQFTYNLDFEQKVFVLAHEIWHCILDHMRRGKQAGHDPHKSNIAADYEVNATISAFGIIPDSAQKKTRALLDHKYDGMAYEQIYAMNPSDPTSGSQNNKGESKKAEKNQQDQDQNQGQGQGQGDSTDQQGEEGSEQSKDNKDQEARGGGNQGTVQPEDCEGAAVDDQPNTPGTFMDRKDGKKLAESEGYEDNQGGDESLAKEWKDVSIKNASKMQGPGASMGQAKIKALWHTTTDWRKAFRDIIGRSLNTSDYRRAYANKNVLVSQDRLARTDKDKWDALDYMVAIIDSSGSISDDMLRYMIGEVYAIAVKVKPIKLVIIQNDQAIQDVVEFHNLAELKKEIPKMKVKGRGGNDLRPVWNFLRTDKRYNKQPAELVLNFTDGYLDQLKRDPKTMLNLTWCILDNPGFELKYPDTKTKVIYLDTSKIKK